MPQPRSKFIPRCHGLALRSQSKCNRQVDQSFKVPLRLRPVNGGKFLPSEEGKAVSGSSAPLKARGSPPRALGQSIFLSIWSVLVHWVYIVANHPPCFWDICFLAISFDSAGVFLAAMIWHLNKLASRLTRLFIPFCLLRLRLRSFLRLWFL